MKHNKLLFLLFLIIIFLIGCTQTTKIVRKDYTYEKMFFGTHRYSFEIHLENMGNSGKVYELINSLIYDHKNFDEYREYREKKFIGNSDEADYPPMIDEDGTEYFYRSGLIEEYSIIFSNNTHIIFEYHEYFYNSGASHGYFRTKFIIIDLAEERILDINDLIYPIPDDLLKKSIVSKYNIDYYSRENIWPPDTVNFCNENIELIWNIYTITPYSDGIIRIEIQDEVVAQYLTDKGKMLRIKSRLAPLLSQRRTAPVH